MHQASHFFLFSWGHICIDHVIINLVAVPKFCIVYICYVLEHVVSSTTNRRKTWNLKKWMLFLTIFKVFVFPRDIHFTHKMLLLEVTTEPRVVHSKLMAKSGHIFGSSSSLSQLKYSCTQGRTKYTLKLTQNSTT